MLAGVRRVLERDDQIEVVGEAHSGPELIAMVDRRRPAVVVMDLRMPGMSGPTCIQRLRAAWPQLKIIVLSACEDPRDDRRRPVGGSQLVCRQERRVGRCRRARPAGGERGCVYHAGPRMRDLDVPPDEPSSPDLTSREQTILAAVAAGMTTAAISQDLWVSEHTVKFHLTNIYRKLGVSNRAAAIRYAFDHQLVGRRAREPVQSSPDLTAAPA